MHDKQKPETPPSTPPTGNPHTGVENGIMNGSLAMMAVCGSIIVVSKRKKEQEVDE